MKRFLEEIKGSQRMEWFLLVAVISAIMLIGFREANSIREQRTDAESRLISALEKIEGIGKADALITVSDDESRVLVIAEGAEDMNVYLYIQRVTHTIVGCGMKDIEIVPYKH